MSAETDRIEAQIYSLTSEREEAQRNYEKYKGVVSRLDKLLFHQTWFSDKRIGYRLEYITEHYIGTNGYYDRLERNPQSAEGKFTQVFADREQKNREACRKNLAAIRSDYDSIVQRYNTAVQRRDEFLRTVNTKDSEISRQYIALAEQRERDRQQEEAARRAAQEAQRRAEEAARAAEQQRAAQKAAEEAAQMMAAQISAAQAAAMQQPSRGGSRRR